MKLFGLRCGLLVLGLATAAKKKPSEKVVSMELEFDQPSGKTKAPITVYSDQDPAHVAVQCAIDHGLQASNIPQIADAVAERIKAEKPDFAPHAGITLDSAKAYEERAHKRKQEGDFGGACHDYVRAHSLLEGAPADEMSGHLSSSLRGVQLAQDAIAAFTEGKHEENLKIQKQIDAFNDGTGRRHKNETLLITMAKSSMELRQWSTASASCGRLLRGCSKRGSWKEKQKRSQAIRIASRAALNMGDLGKALDYWRVVIKADPDTPWAKGDYQNLRQLDMSLNEISKWLGKSKNRQAEEALAEKEKFVRGLKLNTTKLLSHILLEQCRAKSAQKRYEEALIKCDDGIAYLKEKVSGVFLDTTKLAQALKTRAECHMQDNNFDEAVHDIREAQEYLSDEGAKREMAQKQREAEWSKKQWAEHTPEWASKVLDLPKNMEGLPVKKKCEYIKKNFKKFVKKWHPDKAKGDKRRAARKVDEVSQAKSLLYERFKCVGR